MLLINMIIFQPLINTGTLENWEKYLGCNKNLGFGILQVNVVETALSSVSEYDQPTF